MADYIEKGIVLATMSKHGITRNMRANKAVAAIPAADVAPVVHSQWIVKTVRGFPELYCRHCGESPGVLYRFEYCPNCSACMDGTEVTDG